MADVITNVANLTEYDAWIAALPGVDDGDTHVANFTVAGDYVQPSDPGNPAVSIRIQADDTVAYNFDSPTDAHVAFTAATGSAFTLTSATNIVRLKGIRFETASTTEWCIRSNISGDQLITAELCRIIGGHYGFECRDLSSDEFNTLNCVITGARLCGAYIKRSASTLTRTVFANNNTDNNGSFGGTFARVGTSLVNCVSWNNGVNDYASTGASLTNCASGDTSAYGTAPVTGIISADFTNTASDIWTTAPAGALAGAGTGGTDIGLEIGVSNVISITDPKEWFLKQRDKATNTGSLLITGTYSGVVTPTAIEASFNGGAFVTIDASPSGGSYSGTLSGQPSGSGDLIVRFVNDISITTTVQNVGIGIKALFWGQSNFVGVADNAQSYTGAVGGFHKYTVTNNGWQEGNDPFATATNLGSLFPILANLFSSGKSIPVGFVGVAEGSTNLSQWQAGQTYNTRMLNYITNSGGDTEFEIVASWIGESDAGQGTTETDFKNQYNAVINQLETLTGIKSLICGIAQSGAAQDDVRLWTSEIASTNSNVVGYVDMNLVFQALHYETDQETSDTAQALYDGINLAFFSSTASISVTGIPDGTYKTALDDESGNRLFYGDLVYSSESASQAIEVDAGTRVKGYVDDNSTPSVNGAYIELVTL